MPPKQGSMGVSEVPADNAVYERLSLEELEQRLQQQTAQVSTEEEEVVW